MSRQQLCRDFQRGSCRFGNRCKFQHTSQQAAYGNQQGGYNAGANRFAPLGDVSGGGARQQQQQQTFHLQRQSGLAPSATQKEHSCTDTRVCKEQIREDFQLERPTFWRLTCYAHWKFRPNDIVHDVSFDELRAEAYQLAQQGMPLTDIVMRERAKFAAKDAEFSSFLAAPYRGPARTTTTATTTTTTMTASATAPTQTAHMMQQQHFGSSSPFTPSTTAASPFSATTTASAFGKPTAFTPPSPFPQPTFGSSSPATAAAASSAASPLLRAFTFGAAPGLPPSSSSSAAPAPPVAAAAAAAGTPFLSSPFAQTQPSAPPVFGQSAQSTGFGSSSAHMPFGPTTTAFGSSAFSFGSAPQNQTLNPSFAFGMTPTLGQPAPAPSGGFGAAAAPAVPAWAPAGPLPAEFGAGAQPNGNSGPNSEAMTLMGAATGSAMTAQSGECSQGTTTMAQAAVSADGGDIWLKEQWTLGEIPEDEPPPHVRY